MTDVLTVPTHFGDISELSAGLADRVDEERLILYGPTAFEEGSTVGFAVLLIDGSPALEGYGRVSAAVDGGDERAPETRFDIVIDSLQLEGMNEVVYERIVLARQSLTGEEPATGEVSLDQLEAESEVETEAAPVEEPVAEVDVAAEPADWESDEATAVADPEQMAALAESAELGIDETGGAEADVAFDEGAADVEAPAADVDAAEADLAAAVDIDEGAVDAADVDVAAEAVEGAEPEADWGAEPAADFADVDMAAGEADVAEVDMGEVSDVDTGDVDLGDVSMDDDFGALDDGYGADDEPVAARSVASDDIGPPPEDPPIAPSPELPPAPVGFQIPPAEGRLTRPVHPPTWQPSAEPPPEPTESTGFFVYPANELPVPAAAPRPDIDPSLRVQPAPRPDDAASASPDEGEAPEPPQVPLPDEDESDVAPAVEPDSFALGDEVSIQEPEEEEAADLDAADLDAADLDAADLDAADLESAELELDADEASIEMDEAEVEEPALAAAEIEAPLEVDATFDGDLPVEPEELALEEDERV